MEHECNFQDIKTEIYYECFNCIDEIRDQRTKEPYDCKCITKINITKTCLDCFEIQNKIDELNDYLELLLVSIKNDIKNCVNCSHSINEIQDISKQIRKYTYILQQQKFKFQ